MDTPTTKEPVETKSTDALQVKIFSPFKTFYAGNSLSVSAANDTGPFDILPGHHKFLSLIKAGSIIVRDKKGEQTFSVNRGILHVSSNVVSVFLDV